MLRMFVAALLASSVAHAAPPELAHEQLESAACLPAVANGAALQCNLDGRGRPGQSSLTSPSPPPQSYFDSHAARVERNLLIFQNGYTIDQMRQRDTFLLYGRPAGGPAATVGGIGVFSAVVVSVAHAPTPLRPLFDRRLHVGPAVFDGGGMGAGIGGGL